MILHSRHHEQVICTAYLVRHHEQVICTEYLVRHHKQVIPTDDLVCSSSWTSHLYRISCSSSWTSYLYRISCSSSWWNCMFVIPKNNLVYSLWKTGNPYKVSNILTTINRFTIVTNGRQLFCIRIYHFIFSFLK